MSILIREYLSFNDYLNNSYQPVSLTEEMSSLYKINPKSLMVDIEGLHAGPTRNFTNYKEQSLRGSIPSWTKPYLKPLIMHHNEKDGRIIGRIHHVECTDVNTLSGTSALVFTVNVPDPEGMEQIEDGRLMTVSVGVIGLDVRCSICGHQIAVDGPCEDHIKGREYNGRICYWDVYEMEGKELSYVIVPSDIYARNVKVYSPSNFSGSYLKENYENEVDIMGKEKNLDKLTHEELLQEYNKLQEKFDTLEVDKGKLDADLNEATSKITALEGEVKGLKEKVEDSEKLEKDLKEAQGKITSLDKDLKEKTKELEGEVKLREEAEANLVGEKEKTRVEIIERYNLLRKLTNKPEQDAEKLKERTEESLKDAVIDLTEELTSGVLATIAGSLESPGLSIEEQEKKKKKKKDIDLREGLSSLFDNVASVRRIV